MFRVRQLVRALVKRGFALKVGSGLISQRSAPEEHDVYSLPVFISLCAPEERNVLLGEQLHVAPTERNNFKIPGANKHLAPSEQGVSK
jgi:hypothetical protein